METPLETRLSISGTSETTRIINNFLDKHRLCSYKDNEFGFCMGETITENSPYCQLHTALNHYLRKNRTKSSQFCFSWANKTIKLKTSIPETETTGLKDTSPISTKNAIWKVEKTFIKDTEILLKLWSWVTINWHRVKKSQTQSIALAEFNSVMGYKPHPLFTVMWIC